MEKDDIIQLIDQEISNSFAKKIGDTPTDALQLVPKQWVDKQITSVYSAISSSVITSYGGIFGDASDGSASFDGSSQPNGTSLIAGNTYQLIRDVFYSSVILANTTSVLTASYRIFTTGTLTIPNGGGHIENNGFPGGDGLTGTANSGGVAGGVGGLGVLNGSLPGSVPGVGGGKGGIRGRNTPGGQGQFAIVGSIQSVSHSWGTNGSQSPTSKGGDGGQAGGNVGGFGSSIIAGGIATLALNSPHNPISVYNAFDLVSSSIFSINSSAGGAGSGGGGAGGSVDGSGNNDGGGGGSAGGTGGTGGIITIFSKSIINNQANGIQTLGGIGGHGGAGQTPTGTGLQQGGGAGGQGGAGGTGGVIILVTNSYTGTGTISVGGGAGGAGGALGSGAGGGAQGNTGGSGPTGASGSSIMVLV